MASELIGIGVELLGELAKLIMQAVADGDPSTLRKVSDVLPAGHVLHSRIAMEESRIKAAKELAG